VTEDPERELTPEEEARIRSLLASARASDTVPDDVAARLDVVLADLAAGRLEDDAHGSRSRWRRGRLLLAAAAAVGVVGFAAVSVPQLSGLGSENDAKSATSDAGGRSGSAAAPEGDSAGGDNRLAARLSTDSFRGDVRRLLSGDGSYRLAPRTTGSPKSSVGPSATPDATADELAAGACLATPGSGVVRTREVLLDGKPALLEVFGVKDGARVVRAVSCDGTETLASTRIPAR
jgi:hypothetical protein